MNIAPDKKLHLMMGAAIAAFGGFLFSPIIGLVLGFAAGVVKEVYDHVSGKGTSEVLDAVATFVGAVAGAAFSWVVITYGTQNPFL